MDIDLFEKLPPFFPIDSFALSGELQRVEGVPSARSQFKRCLLPDTSELLNQEQFAEIALGWNQKALLICARIRIPFEGCSFTNFRAGESLELFIDTRDLKTTSALTRFCHQFVILPQEVDGLFAREVTPLRADDSRPLCDPAEITVTAEVGRKEIQLDIVIPATALFGYDPSSFNRLGFTYRVNRTGNEPQNFALSPLHQMEKQPQLWASFELVS